MRWGRLGSKYIKADFEEGRTTIVSDREAIRFIVNDSTERVGRFGGTK